MKAPPIPTALFLACLAGGLLAAEDSGAKTPPKELIRALLLEDAKNKAAKPAPASTLPPETKLDKPDLLPAPPSDSAATPETASTPQDTAAKSAANAKPAEPATVLPQVEVNKSRINVLDREIHEQDKDIAREQKNTKSTELDKALNDSKVSTALSVLGGQSADYRANLAKERVGLMQDERDILEQMKLARTAKEKAELQKELDEIRAIRRDLEKNLR